MKEQKPYFTKYLPVEGEIKEGDSVAFNGDTTNVFKIGPKVTVLLEKDKKVKLFLCSRDIQVGDKFTQKGIDMLHPTARFTCIGFTKDGDIKDDDNHAYAAATVYKVIGEVSPEAIWVKEGMEFEESEVKITHIDDESIIIDRDSMSGDPVFGSKKIIKIKCSQCKTFH